ncbi:MarR family winged helix-turn-helix transcriptional regulator [Pseudonocardia sp. GCM10023141]|uniref:MarR family winged helix-turn-helix transcriptional regulator n=1 Tax=Pseudonocardia sp. GCM10023141 TaxID=3252653 RepID=UPI0036158DBC
MVETRQADVQVVDAQQTTAGIERELMLLGRHHLSPVHSRAPVALDRSAYVILNRLEADRALSAREIATALTLEISTVTRQISAMLRTGLVERIPDPDGGLARKIRPTPAGLASLAADRDVHRCGIAVVLQTWTPDDRATLLDSLRRLNERIEELQASPWPRPAQRS